MRINVTGLSWSKYWESSGKSFLEKYIQSYKMRVGYKKLLNAVSEINNPGKVLEVGAGKAYISRILRDIGWFTVAVDLNYDISFFNSNAVDHYLTGDIFKLPFKDQSFDLIISCGLIEHFKLDVIKGMLSEMTRVGKSIVAWYPTSSFQWRAIWALRNIFGGNIYLETYKHSEEKIRNIFKSTGLINIKTGYVDYGFIWNYIFIHGMTPN